MVQLHKTGQMITDMQAHAYSSVCGCVSYTDNEDNISLPENADVKSIKTKPSSNRQTL